jgi:hypothetical protein
VCEQGVSFWGLNLWSSWGPATSCLFAFEKGPDLTADRGYVTAHCWHCTSMQVPILAIRTSPSSLSGLVMLTDMHEAQLLVTSGWRSSHASHCLQRVFCVVPKGWGMRWVHNFVALGADCSKLLVRLWLLAFSSMCAEASRCMGACSFHRPAWNVLPYGMLFIRIVGDRVGYCWNDWLGDAAPSTTARLRPTVALAPAWLSCSGSVSCAVLCVTVLDFLYCVTRCTQIPLPSCCSLSWSCLAVVDAIVAADLSSTAGYLFLCTLACGIGVNTLAVLRLLVFYEVLALGGTSIEGMCPACAFAYRVCVPWCC